MRNNKPNFFKIRKRLMIEVDYSLAQINGIIQFYRDISLAGAQHFSAILAAFILDPRSHYSDYTQNIRNLLYKISSQFVNGEISLDVYTDELNRIAHDPHSTDQHSGLEFDMDDSRLIAEHLCLNDLHKKSLRNNQKMLGDSSKTLEKLLDSELHKMTFDEIQNLIDEIWKQFPYTPVHLNIEREEEESIKKNSHFNL